jgi:nucleotide-binding universal stress UspA family protein
MKRRIQLLVDSSRDSDAATAQAINMADRFDSALVATEIRNSRRFESYRKTEEARQLFQKRLHRISDMAQDHGVEISDMRSKAVIDQPKDILKISQKIDPNVVISSAMDGRSGGPGLSDRAAGLFKYSKYNLLLVKDPQHDAHEYKNILVSADSPFDISDYTAEFADKYDAKLTAVQVVDLEEGLVKERPVYLSDAARSTLPGMPRKGLGETIKTSETLLTKMKESGIRKAQSMADAVADVARERGIDADTKVLVGRRDDQIAQLTKQQQFDLLMIGSNRENLVKRLMHKTVPETLVRKVDSSVFAVRKVA